MNIFTIFSDKFGSVGNAVTYLNMMGSTVNVTRYNDWANGNGTPRRETLDLILTTAVTHVFGSVDGITLSPVINNTLTVEQVPAEPEHRLDTVVDISVLRSRLPHRRFSDNFFNIDRLYDAQVLTAIYGHDVFTRFVAMCGNFQGAVYVLRRHPGKRRIVESWVKNHERDGWYADTVNTMVALLDQYEGTGTRFDGIVLNKDDKTPQTDERALKRKWVIENMKSRFNFDVDPLIHDEGIEAMYQSLLEPV